MTFFSGALRGQLVVLHLHKDSLFVVHAGVAVVSVQEQDSYCAGKVWRCVWQCEAHVAQQGVHQAAAVAECPAK